MGTFDAFFEKAADVANTAGKKTGEVVETSKLKVKSAGLSSDVRQAFQQLGNIVYEARKTGSDCSGLIEEWVAKIDGLKEELLEIEERIGGIKQMKKCANCGASVNAEVVYCPRCGSKIQE